MEQLLKDDPTPAAPPLSLPHSSPSPRRWLLFALALSLLFAARIYCAWGYRVDSDEPQHLHVVWGVSHGLVQYRDLFDNHSPLFALLNAPLFRLVGQHADIVPLMRLGMIPFYFGCILCVYLVASRLFSPRCGAWAALITAFHPRFFTTSLEFRPDDLWAFCWLALLAVLVRVRRPGPRWAIAGLLLGTAFSLSMKTTLMTADLAVAGALAWLLGGRPGIGWRQGLSSAALFAAGAAVVPGGLLLWFYSQGALGSLVYCLIEHNLIAVSQRVHLFDPRAAASIAAFAAVAWWSRKLLRSRSPLAFTRGAVMLAGGFYPVLLFFVWPLVTREDFLPFLPMAALVIAPALLALPKPAWPAWSGNAALAGAFCLMLGFDLWAVRPWQQRSRFHSDFLTGIMKLTGPRDEVMDCKGEMIYRERPIYFALEEMTRWRYSRNLLVDDIPEIIAARGVCVATDNYGRFPKRARQFIKKNFVRVAFRTLVAGKILNPGGPVTSFEITIPARYAVVTKNGGPVLLDGQPCAGDVLLEPGRHVISAPVNPGPVAVVWARAVEQGFDPFYQPDWAENDETHRARVGNIM